MEELLNKTFILKNNERYSVIETIIYEKKIYVYLVNENDEMDAEFKEIITENNECILLDIDKEKFKDNILNLFL